MLIHVLRTRESGCVTAFMPVNNLPENEGIVTLLPPVVTFSLNPRVEIPMAITIGAWSR